MINEKDYNKVEFDQNGKPVIKLVNRELMLKDELVMDNIDLSDLQELSALLDYNIKEQTFGNMYQLVDNYDFTHYISKKMFFELSTLLSINNQNANKHYYSVINIANQYPDRLTRYVSFIKN